MTDPRLRAAKQIVDFEGRRDKAGNLIVYRLPSNDGGGTYEVAGINNRYHPEAAAHIADLIKKGQPAQAEAFACEYIADYTEAPAKHFPQEGINFLVRDICWNRGMGGANAAIRFALSMDPKDRRAAHRYLSESEVIAAQEAAKSDPNAFMAALTKGRERYEYKFVGKRPNFDAGLRNRWKNALAAALQFPSSPLK